MQARPQNSSGLAIFVKPPKMRILSGVLSSCSINSETSSWFHSLIPCVRSVPNQASWQSSLKVLEKIAFKRLITLLAHGKLGASQFAYRPSSGGGCTSALPRLQSPILEYLDGRFQLTSQIARSRIFDVCGKLQFPLMLYAWI